ncbi:MAG: cysteine desulfurase family protein [bacterium]|nr:cysteine desulfurase family protein [bacterium]
MKQIYLDYAAATPMDPIVIKAMEPYFFGKFHNPSAIYLAGQAARKSLQDARVSIAQNLGARPAEITFTAGATEANNLAIQGVMKNFPAGEALVSSIEHESILAPAGLFNTREIPVDKNGRVILDSLEKMISDKTVLVSVGLVNNEIGTIQPLRDIAEILNKSRKLRGPKGLPLYFHTDAAQAPNYFDLHISRLGVDLLTINGGKIYGPKQSGALYVRAGVKLRPLILGGGQENGLRPGTENVAGAVGLAVALDLAQNMRNAQAERMAELRQLFIEALKVILPTVVVNGSPKNSAPHIVSVTFAGVDNERLMMELDERGLQVATGSACSASNDKPSHVLVAVGLNNKEAGSTLRFSFGRQTSESDIKYTLKTLSQLLEN